MSCIKNDLIQKYIDGEATGKEIARIENHISSCTACATGITNQRKLAKGIKNAINRIGEHHAEIPGMVPVTGLKDKSRFRIRNFVYDVAAACLLIFIVVFIQRKEPEPQDMIMMVPAFAGDVDANRPVSKQSIIIQVIDADGRVSEYFTGQEESLK